MQERQHVLWLCINSRRENQFYVWGFFIKGAQKTQEKLSELVLQVQVVGAVLFFEEIVADKCRMERHPFKCRDS